MLIYLNEFDQFIKHRLRVKHYIRYVDDFVILHQNKDILSNYKTLIDEFLRTNLKLSLHPDKSRIIKLEQGIGFLGFRIFFYHKLIRKKNLLKFEKKFKEMKHLYKEDIIPREEVMERFEGWLAYVRHGNTYKYRKHLVREINKYFPIEKPIKITSVKKHENFVNKIERSDVNFSSLKSLMLLNKGLSIEQIAKKRGIKAGTVWDHFAKLIEYNQLSLWKILSKEKISKILPYILSPTDKLSEIKHRIKDTSTTYNEINSVLAFVKSKNKKRNICQLASWYQKSYCFRKCYFDKEQRKACKLNFDLICSKNPKLEMNRQEFLNFFNDHLSICVLPEVQKLEYVSWQEFKARLVARSKVIKGKNK